jgi:hypothetical protein
LTYYVVAHWEGELFASLLIPVATLPVGAVEYPNVLESEGIVRTSFVKKRGLYL